MLHVYSLAENLSLCLVYHSILQFSIYPNIIIIFRVKLLLNIIKYQFSLNLNTSLTLETIYMADFVLNATHSSRELNVAQAQKLHKMPREIVTYLKEWEDVSKIYYVTRCQNSALRQP